MFHFSCWQSWVCIYLLENSVYTSWRYYIICANSITELSRLGVGDLALKALLSESLFTDCLTLRNVMTSESHCAGLGIILQTRSIWNWYQLLAGQWDFQSEIKIANTSIGNSECIHHETLKIYRNTRPEPSMLLCCYVLHLRINILAAHWDKYMHLMNRFQNIMPYKYWGIMHWIWQGCEYICIYYILTDWCGMKSWLWWSKCFVLLKASYACLDTIDIMTECFGIFPIFTQPLFHIVPLRLFEGY